MTGEDRGTRAGRLLGRLRTALLALALGVPAATTLAVTPSLADFRVCNEADDTVGVALGYRGQDGWVSEGWWHVPGGQCQILVSGALTSRFYYLYAENAERSARWGGEVRMCTAQDEFKIVDVKDCIARGYARMGFGEYDTGDQSSWTVRLTAQSTGTGGVKAMAGQDPNGANAATN